MLYAPTLHSLLAFVALFAFGSSAEAAECLPFDTYHPATDTTLEQCCPRFATQPENVDCSESSVDGFTAVTCKFRANGNIPYAYLVPQTTAVSQPLYVHLQGGAGESARLHKGGLGAQINGTMKATPGAVLWIYAGAGQPNEDRVQAGRGVFWGSGGGYSSIGEGKANGHSESEIGGHCFKHAQHGNQGDCRLLVAAGGGGAGPGGDGDPAGTSKLGMRQDMYGESPEDGASGGGGGGYLGGKVWQGHGGGGGAMRLGPGHFTTLYRTASPSTTAFVSIRASCSAPPAYVPSAAKHPSDIVMQVETDDGSRALGFGSQFLHRRRVQHPKFAREA